MLFQWLDGQDAWTLQEVIGQIEDEYRVSYHRPKVVQEFLGQLNGGLLAEAWKTTCIRLAPNAPEQNLVEDIWLQAKQFIRKYARLCRRFGSVKFLF